MDKKGRDKKGKSMSCSFCGRNYNVVKRLIQGDRNVYICNECIEACFTLIQKDKDRTATDIKRKIPTPAYVKDSLDEYIIGQESAKRVLEKVKNFIDSKKYILNRINGTIVSL